MEMSHEAQGRVRKMATAHERVAREFIKQTQGEAAQRLEALRAADFEGYQQLLRASGHTAVAGQDEKFKGGRLLQ
jgi:two-component sensor histidine kinase